MRFYVLRSTLGLLLTITDYPGAHGCAPGCRWKNRTMTTALIRASPDEALQSQDEEALAGFLAGYSGLAREA